MKPPQYYSRFAQTQATQGGNLPHWSQWCATFTTFRLADSLPEGKLEQFRAEREEWLRAHGIDPHTWGRGVSPRQDTRGRGVSPRLYVDGLIPFDAVGTPRLRVDESRLRGDEALGDAVSSPRRNKDVSSSSDAVGTPRLRGDESRLRGDESRLRGDESRLRGDESRLRVDESRLRGDEARLQLSPAERSEYRELFSERFHAWLDAGHGSCVLNNLRARTAVEESLRHFADVRYSLYGFVVKPNHVHVLFMPEEGFDSREIVADWKRFTAHEVNRMLGREGILWQKESYDRLVRDADQFNAYRAYIRQNDANLAYDAYAEGK